MALYPEEAQPSGSSPCDDVRYLVAMTFGGPVPGGIIPEPRRDPRRLANMNMMCLFFGAATVLFFGAATVRRMRTSFTLWPL